MLTQITGTSAATLSLFMLIYGVMAALGNIWGGKLTDTLGVNRATLSIISAIVVVVFSLWPLAHSAWAMGILIALLGMLTFASVPALQARLLGIAEQHVPQAHGIAAGLNIAGFNSGIALGSVAGGLTITHAGLIYTGVSGALISLAGLALLIAQYQRTRYARCVSH